MIRVRPFQQTEIEHLCRFVEYEEDGRAFPSMLEPDASHLGELVYRGIPFERAHVLEAGESAIRAKSRRRSYSVDHVEPRPTWPDLPINHARVRRQVRAFYETIRIDRETQRRVKEQEEAQEQAFRAEYWKRFALTDKQRADILAARLAREPLESVCSRLNVSVDQIYQVAPKNDPRFYAWRQCLSGEQKKESDRRRAEERRKYKEWEEQQARLLEEWEKQHEERNSVPENLDAAIQKQMLDAIKEGDWIFNNGKWHIQVTSASRYQKLREQTTALIGNYTPWAIEEALQRNVAAIVARHPGYLR